MRTLGAGMRVPRRTAVAAARGAALSLLVAGGLAAQEAPRIREVTIRTVDVFSDEEAARGWVYQAADALHRETRTSVIRKFLLFREGDPCSPALLEETERNLRALPFLKSATVVAHPAGEGLVDVEVVTQDSWTTEPGLSLGGSGGATTYGVRLEEKNLLGLGKQLGITFDRKVERTNRFIQYRDPYVFGPYWFLDLAYGLNSDGHRQQARLGRPFVSSRDRWSVDGLYDDLVQKARLYAEGDVVSRFEQRRRRLRLQYGRAIEAGEGHARRLTAGYESSEDRFAQLADRPEDARPRNRLYRDLFVQYEDVTSDYVKWNYVNRDLKYEDFNLGARFGVRVGVSPTAFGLSETTLFTRIEGSRGIRIGSGGLLVGKIGWESRWESEGSRNGILSGEILSVWRFRSRLRQTLVSRLRFDRGWNLDPDLQFFADGETGLRAYRLYAFQGDERILWNVEHRVFSGREILQLVSPGAAVFFDAGAAAPAGQTLKLSTFHADVGVGLRFGIARASSNNVIRIDLAYALDSDPRGKRGFLVSFSSGQAF